MKKIYTKPNAEIHTFDIENVITVSGLKDGGSNGTAKSESYSSLFGE